MRRDPRQVLRRIGPEILAAASDNDPTNVGTAVAVGARTAYQLAWVALLVAPLLAIVQSIAAQVGIAARADLQALVRRRFGPGAAALLLVSVVVVNIVTIAADLQAGAAGLGALLGVDESWLVVPLGLGLVALLFVGRYDEIVAVLRYVLIGFLAFGAAAVLARPDWPRLIQASLVPSLPSGGDGAAGALALLGTTLTSYVYVWETIERGVEEPPSEPRKQGLASARAGAVIGALFTGAILWCMLVASGATLGQAHVPVGSAKDAARVLRPLAGPLGADLFALGLIVSAVVALPVLMATTAHVVGAHFDWRRGLSEDVGRARGFYAVLAASVALAVAVDLTGVPVLEMLLAASLIGGLATPIGLVLLVRLARDPEVMGELRISRGLAMGGTMVAVLLGAFGLLYLLGLALGQRAGA